MNENTTKREIRATEIHQVVQEVLAEHFALDMSESNYESADIFDVLIAAAVEQITIEMSCELLKNAPSANTVRSRVREMLSDEKALKELESTINQMLVSRLPRKLLSSKLPGAIDVTEIPYHGEHDEEDDHIRRSKPKDGTSHFFCFGTLYVVKKHRRYTIALTLYRRSDTPVTLLERLLTQGKTLGLRLKRLYLDRGFDSNGVVGYLKTQPFPAIMPLVHRGPKGGGSRKMMIGRKGHTTSYTRRSKKYGEQLLPLTIVCKYSM